MFILIAIILIIVGFFLVIIFLPILMIGQPLSLFSINNTDDSMNHTLTVEIFDSDNSSLFKKTYFLEPKERVEYNRSFGIYPTFSWSFITWSDGIYTFKFTLDNDTIETHTTDLCQYKSVCVFLYDKIWRTNETIPINIREEVV
jgi:hypothetical protein